LTPDWNHPTMTKEEHYILTLSDSKFCPVLRGNNIETFRMYECLESVVIPFYVRQEGVVAYWKWISEKLGLFELNSWNKVQSYISIFVKNVEAAEKNRLSILERWTAWKNEVQNNVRKLL